jgi:hypothetical protein
MLLNIFGRISTFPTTTTGITVFFFNLPIVFPLPVAPFRLEFNLERNIGAFIRILFTRCFIGEQKQQLAQNPEMCLFFHPHREAEDEYNQMRRRDNHFRKAAMCCRVWPVPECESRVEGWGYADRGNRN